MKNLMSKVDRFMKSEDGPTAVEYAVMLALIIVVCITTIGTLGTEAEKKFKVVSDKLSSTSAGGSTN